MRLSWGASPFHGLQRFNIQYPEPLARLRPKRPGWNPALQKKTAGVEPGPPENTTMGRFLTLEGRLPCRPGSFCMRLSNIEYPISKWDKTGRDGATRDALRLESALGQ